jgi:helicase
MIKLTDQKQLIPTSQFPVAKFSFEKFNPVQSRIFEVYDKDINCIVAAQTSSGKTEIAEMFLANEVRQRGGKGVYLSPLRSLSQEKIDKWLDPKHHFSDLNVSICTGDYRLTAERGKELERADLIIMTNEIFNSLSRNYKSEKSKFLKQVGTVCADEFHILTTPSRGHHCESGFMKFTQVNPDARMIFLSATVPNSEQISNWTESLNHKETYLMESSYRPCPLSIHYERYRDKGSYDEQERQKVESAIRVFHRHYGDKFIFFVHTKRTGELLRASLKEQLIECEYLNADLGKDKKKVIENRFREDPKLKALVATSVVAWGLNFPSRRVVIVGVHRGLSEVENYDIQQECGRAGRPQYDPAGDAHILLPDSTFAKHLTRLQKPYNIESQLLDNKALAFHLVSEIHHQEVKNKKDIDEWYGRSLASFQEKELDKSVVNQVLDKLVKCKSIKMEDNDCETTSLGVVSSLFYYSPFDVVDLHRNWSKIFELDEQGDDYWVSMALGNLDTHRGMIVSNAEREETGLYAKKINHISKGMTGEYGFSDGAVKIGCCYYNLLNGKDCPILNSIMVGLKTDFDRTVEVLTALDSMAGKWDRRDYFKRLQLRILYGVKEELLDIVRLKGVGKVKSKKLWDAGLKTLDDIADNPVAVIKAISCSSNVAQQICENAKYLSML